MQGLAASGMAGSTNDQMIAEVIRLLLDGVDPQTLLDQGVPPEILQQAMEVVLSQNPVGGSGMPMPAAPPQTEAGLAATAIV